MTVTTDEETTAATEIEQPPDDTADTADDSEATDDTDATEAPEATEATETKVRRPWKRSKRYARVAAVLAVYLGAFGAAGALGWKLWDQHAVSQAGLAAQRTAIDYAQALTSIDSNQVDQNFNAVLAGATGEFKNTYTKASGQLRQLLVDNKATAHGIVVDSAIQSETKDRVVVLLMVDQTVSNTARPDGRVDRSRMKVTMQKVDGRWLASKVELP